MFKGRDVIGKTIVSYDDGEKFDVVKDLIFEQEGHQLLGFLVREVSWFNHAHILLFGDIQAIGVDAVIANSQALIVRASQTVAVSHILDHNTVLKGTHILTMDGRDLGIIVDLYFDEKTCKVEGYEVSGGLFADAYSGRSFVPASETFKIGRDVAFVPNQTACLMEEQVGGFRSVMQTVSDHIQEGAQVTGDKLQELSQTASDAFQETSRRTGHQLQDLGHFANARSREAQNLGHTAAANLTNAIISPEAQKVFIIGKSPTHTVLAPSGSPLAPSGQPISHATADQAEALGVLDELYQAAGGTWSAPLGTRLGDAIANLTVEHAEGRRVRSMVRNEAGSIVAAPGQIVTSAMIERARLDHRERLLLQAVGLSTGEALQESANRAVTAAGDHTASAGEQIKVNAKKLWSQAKAATSSLQRRSSQAIEDQKINGALGRPVTRVILDHDDAVILNLGDLITHQAIDKARQANVLNQLLSSVNTDKPQIYPEDITPPQPGFTTL